MTGMKKVTSFQLGLRVFAYIVVAALIGIMVNFIFVNAQGAVWSAILLQTVLFLLLFGVVYSTAWRDGYSEMNRVKIGFTTYEHTKGLKAGLYAMIPGLAITFALAVTRLISAEADWSWLYRIVNFYALSYINHFIDPSLSFSQISVWNILLSGAYWLAVPFVTWGAFVLGYHRFSIMEVLYFKKKKTDEPTGKGSRKKR